MSNMMRSGVFVASTSCNCCPLLATATSNPFLLSAKVMISCTSLSSSTTTTRFGISYSRLRENPCISIFFNHIIHATRSKYNTFCCILHQRIEFLLSLLRPMQELPFVYVDELSSLCYHLTR